MKKARSWALRHSALAIGLDLSVCCCEGASASKITIVVDWLSRWAQLAVEVDEPLLKISILSWATLARLNLARLANWLLKLLKVQWSHLDNLWDGGLLCCLVGRGVSWMDLEARRDARSHLGVLMPIVLVCSVATGVLAIALMICSRSARDPAETRATCSRAPV